MEEEKMEIEQKVDALIFTAKKENYTRKIIWQPGNDWDLIVEEKFKDEDAFEKYAGKKFNEK